MTLVRVEVISANLLEFYLFQQIVKEHLEKDHHVLVLVGDFLYPLNVNFVGFVFVGVFKGWQLGIHSKCINAVSEIDEEANLFF